MMSTKITVLVKPRSSQERVVETGERAVTVWVRATPCDGKANEAVRDALARHFKLPRSQVRLASGAASRHKVFELIA